jgi:hypothetical protein
MAGLPTTEMKPGGGYVMCLHDQIKHLEAENAKLRKALEYIREHRLWINSHCKAVVETALKEAQS